MKLSRFFSRLSKICFLLLWIPFAILMFQLFKVEEGSYDSIPEPLTPWIYFVIGLGLLAIFSIIFSMIFGALANRRVLKNGQPVEAKILGLGQTGTMINGNPVLRFTLEVHSTDQGVFMVEVDKLVTLVDLPSYSIDATIMVKYIPGTKQVAIP